MPNLLQHIDEIAIEKNRTVLFLRFCEKLYDHEYNPGNDTLRDKILRWLDTHSVPYYPCGPMQNPLVMASYDGTIYLDVPMDETLDLYQLLCDEFDHDKYPKRVTFQYLPLKYAKKNRQRVKDIGEVNW